MKRHPSLRALSRDHYQGLVLAKKLQNADSESAPAALLAEVQRRWEEVIAPHFFVEERELVPLSICGGESLCSQAEEIRSQHAELRRCFAGLNADNMEAQGAVLGRLLAAHIRFEERSWFPALEAALNAETMQALSWRLQANPESIIQGFERDGKGEWVAILDCGHSRHIRHQPPFRYAPWVESERGRDSQLGARIGCSLCHMPRLPHCLKPQKETPLFSEHSVPAGLLRSHQLRAGTWGQIVVEAGRVHYVLEDEGGRTFVLHPGVVGVVAPERPHHVRPQHAARFRVRFLRCSGDTRAISDG